MTPVTQPQGQAMDKKLPITRTQLDGRRRMGIRLTDLADDCGASYADLSAIMDKLPLRLGKDFATDDKKGVILSLEASQAVLIFVLAQKYKAQEYNFEAWHRRRRISNIINGVTR